MDNATNISQPIATNTTGSPKCSASGRSDYEKWVSVIVYIVIIIFGLVGNSLVIVIVQKNQRMKNATNYLIVNLSVTEILSTLINVNFSMVAIAIYPKYLPYVNDIFAIFVCKSLGFMDSLTHSLSTLSLTIIAFDRFFAVKYPLKRIITRGRSKKIIAVIWLLSILASSPQLYASSYKDVNSRLICPKVWAPMPENSDLIYVSTHLVLFYVIPLTVMGVLYSITVRKLWARRIPGNVTEANQRLQQHAKHNVLKMCITVVVLFALCWLPLYIIVILIQILKCGIPNTLSKVIIFLAHAYYAANPCIYFAFSKDYRRGFRHIFKPLVDNYGRKFDRSHHRSSDILTMRVRQRTDVNENGIVAISFQSLGTNDVKC